MWLDELLAGHPERFKEQFRMSKSAFQRLSREPQLHSGLTDRRQVTADEQLVTLLYIARTGSSVRVLQERFQRSPSTISGQVPFITFTDNVDLLSPRSIERVLNALVSAPFYTKYLKESPDCTPSYIERSYRFFPYFKDRRGAIDGSHVDAYVPDEAVTPAAFCMTNISTSVQSSCADQRHRLDILTSV